MGGKVFWGGVSQKELLEEMNLELVFANGETPSTTGNITESQRISLSD